MGKHTSGWSHAVWPRRGCFGAEGISERTERWWRSRGQTQRGGEAEVRRWRQWGAAAQPSRKRVMETWKVWKERAERSALFGLNGAGWWTSLKSKPFLWNCLYAYFKGTYTTCTLPLNLFNLSYFVQLGLFESHLLSYRGVFIDINSGSVCSRSDSGSIKKQTFYITSAFFKCLKVHLLMITLDTGKCSF